MFVGLLRWDITLFTHTNTQHCAFDVKSPVALALKEDISCVHTAQKRKEWMWTNSFLRFCDRRQFRDSHSKLYLCFLFSSHIALLNVQGLIRVKLYHQRLWIIAICLSVCNTVQYHGVCVQNFTYNIYSIIIVLTLFFVFFFFAVMLSKFSSWWVYFFRRMIFLSTVCLLIVM